MDERFLEVASAREQREREYGIERAARANGAEKHPDFDGLHCVECDDTIPALRLNMGKVRCVICQTTKERKNAHKA